MSETPKLPEPSMANAKRSTPERVREESIEFQNWAMRTPVETRDKFGPYARPEIAYAWQAWYRRAKDADASLAEAEKRESQARDGLYGWLRDNGPGGWIDDLRNKAAALEIRLAEAEAHLDRLTGMKFSDRMHAALVSRAEEAERLLAEARADAGRYRLLRRGQHWSVVNGVGDDLRAEALDDAIDAALRASRVGG